ncbi:hypothetical protein Cst04h_26030 [Corynebacterium striatum]|uniref:Uncharacterized protein n=1 Tax=Corynebacterium striatum TaxID=43770 RepID=A0ABC9ZR51_CORST|nr:hypothetical protein Cst04h_26030 [Corynebacterium striatum]
MNRGVGLEDCHVEALAVAAETRCRLWQEWAAHAASTAIAERAYMWAAHCHERDLRTPQVLFGAGRAEFRLFKSQVRV